MKSVVRFLGVAILLAGVGCEKGGGPESGDNGFAPINPAAAVFWDRQTTESAQLLQTLASEFNTGRTGLPLKVEHTGGYSDIFRKVSASIQARTLPAMAVAYQSMTAEYALSGAVLPLDDLIADPSGGIPKEDLGDFFPAVLETNRYPDHANKMLSFPFCKSVLIMYFNRKVLSEAGFSEPPKTWDAFLEQCRAVKTTLGKKAYPVNVDCSTITGFIYSMGGNVVRERTTLFDSPEVLKVFSLYETLAREGLAYQITPGAYDDETALAQNEAAFAFRSSSGRTNVALLMEGDQERWGMAAIPQSDPAKPRTVLYGPNIVIFKTNADQQRAAWDFAKFFTSKETGVRWALGTGYLPIRKSAAESPEMQKFWAEWPYNRAGYDCLSFAETEPALVGWQEVRTLVENALTEILTGVKTAQEAAVALKKKADEVLARS